MPEAAAAQGGGGHAGAAAGCHARAERRRFWRDRAAGALAEVLAWGHRGRDEQELDGVVEEQIRHVPEPRDTELQPALRGEHAVPQGVELGAGAAGGEHQQEVRGQRGRAPVQQRAEAAVEMGGCREVDPESGFVRWDREDVGAGAAA